MPLDPEEVAEFTLERARSDPKAQRMVEEVRQLDGLTEHTGWLRLRDALQESQKKFLHDLAQRLLAGEVVDQRDIDYQRGFYAGAKYVIERPAKAANNLERAAQMAYATAKAELLSSMEGEDSPYL